jgi:putative lipoprotein (rSAM/lipoprotein system)
MPKPVKVIYRFLGWLFALITVGSFVGCMYGVPAKYRSPNIQSTPKVVIEKKIKLQGKVVEKGGDPIKGIKVDILRDSGSYTNTSEVFTNNDGTYTIEFTSDLESVKIQAADVDGKENGGEFIETDIQVDVSKSVTQEINFEMESK